MNLDKIIVKLKLISEYFYKNNIRLDNIDYFNYFYLYYADVRREEEKLRILTKFDDKYDYKIKDKQEYQTIITEKLDLIIRRLGKTECFYIQIKEFPYLFFEIEVGPSYNTGDISTIYLYMVDNDNIVYRNDLEGNIKVLSGGSIITDELIRKGAYRAINYYIEVLEGTQAIERRINNVRI